MQQRNFNSLTPGLQHGGSPTSTSFIDKKQNTSHVSTPIGMEEEVKVVQQDLDGEEGSGGHSSVNSFQNYLDQGQNMNNMNNMGELSQTESALEELCPVTGDVLVAYSRKLGRLVCNQCIFQENAENTNSDCSDPLELDFTSFVAQELKELFDAKFKMYKTQLSQMQQVAPTKISGQLETTVNNFFVSIDKQIKSIEAEYIDKLNSSSNLNALTELLKEASP